MSTRKITVQSKLFKLKEWLTLSDAARHLSLMFEEEVEKADIFRLVLDGHLKLSVNFVNLAYGKCGKLFSYDEEKELPDIEFFSLCNSLPVELKKSKDTLISGYKTIGPFPGYYLDLDEKVTTIEGIWDLPMIHGQQYYIEHEYQMLTGGPAVESPIIGAAFVTREGGQVCRLHDKLEGVAEYETKHGMKTVDFDNEPNSYYPAIALPNDSILVIRTKELLNLQESLSVEQPPEGVNNNSLDPNHSFYAKELKISIKAWTELYDENPPQYIPPGGHKKYITKWLTANYPSLSQRAKNRITTIVNPNPKGGASPTE